MRIISSRVHGLIDYITGATFIALPWILGFNKYGPETFVLVGAGILTLVLAVLTRYEYGVLRRIPMKSHLIIDALTAVLVIASPWLFDFSEAIFLPHVLIGAVELLAVIMTDPVSMREHKFLDGKEIYHVAHNTTEEGIRKSRGTSYGKSTAG